MILWVIAPPKLVITKKQTLTYNAQKSRIPTNLTKPSEIDKMPGCGQ